MTLTLGATTEVRRLPDIALVEPQAADGITPMSEVLGLPGSDEPPFLVQARTLVEDHPQSGVAWARLAQAEQAVGNHERAIEGAQRGLALSPKTSAAALASVSILASYGQEGVDEMLASSSHPMAAIRWARSAIEAGNVPLAFERLEGVETSAARALRAYCLVEMGECARAVREYRFLLRRGRRTLDVLINMGVALARLGSLEKAMSVTRQATLLSPANTVASHNLARYLLATGDRGGAVRELARVSSAVPGDYKSALYSAWARANFLHDHRGALAALLDARARFARSGDDAARAEIAGSIAFLQFLLGEIDRPRARRSLAAALELAEFASGDLARMYATFLERTSDLPALDDLLARAGNSVDDLDRALLETRRALLARDPEAATARALDAASLDSEAGTEAAATAAYLVGEVTGDYPQGAAIAERAFRRSPDAPLANNFAFNLALAGEPRRAMRVLDQFGIEELPFHGATVALTLLCLGAIEEGMALYGRAIEMTLADGDPTTAGYMRLRARIALRQVGAGHPDASPASVLEAWPRDAGDPRWEVMRRVAQRTGVDVPDAGALSR